MREGKPLKSSRWRKSGCGSSLTRQKCTVAVCPHAGQDRSRPYRDRNLADDASKVNRIFDRLQLDVVDTGMAEAVDEVAQDMEAVPTEVPDTPQKEPQKEEAPVFPFPARRQTEPEPVSPSTPSSNSSEKSPPMWPGFRADQVRARGKRPSVRLELGEIRAILAARKEHSPMPRSPIRIHRDGPVRG